MSKTNVKGIGIVCLILCVVLLFAAKERYEANEAGVDALNQIISGNLMVEKTSFGATPPAAVVAPIPSVPPNHPNVSFTPQFASVTPVATTYALFFAFLFAAGALTCFYHVNAMTLAEKLAGNASGES